MFSVPGPHGFPRAAHESPRRARLGAVVLLVTLGCAASPDATSDATPDAATGGTGGMGGHLAADVSTTGDGTVQDAAVFDAGHDDASSASDAAQTPLDGGPPPDCPALEPTPCLETVGCVLELAGEPETYRCRDAVGACERVKDAATCQADAACAWEPGVCYCPPDGEIVCACGGGPPPVCRQADARLCAPDLRLRRTGGLCREGPCFTELRFQRDGYLFLDDQTASTPVDGFAPSEAAQRIVGLLNELRDLPLEAGYGPCCNADFDGSDDYLEFLSPDGPALTVRVSRREEAPAALRSLLERLDAAEAALREPAGTARAAACPGPAEMPSRATSPELTPSCATTEVLAARFQGFSLRGPGEQEISRQTVRLDGVDPSVFPIDFRLAGSVVEVPDGGNGFVLADAGGARWRLEWDRPPGTVPVPEPCVVLGQSLSLAVRATFGFELYDLGLLVQDERGVLFAVDEGFAGVHMLPESPFQVEVTDGGCPENPDVPSFFQPQQLVFRAGEARLDLYTGAWGRLDVPNGYDLFVYDLRSYLSRVPDDGGNHAYFALAVPGSDFAGCGGP